MKLEVYPSRDAALEAYTKAYHTDEVRAYPLPGSKYWTPALGPGSMRSISSSTAPGISSGSTTSSAFWGHTEENWGVTYNSQGEPTKMGPRSTALERQLAVLGFDV